MWKSLQGGYFDEPPVRKKSPTGPVDIYGPTICDDENIWFVDMIPNPEKVCVRLPNVEGVAVQFMDNVFTVYVSYIHDKSGMPQGPYDLGFALTPDPTFTEQCFLWNDIGDVVGWRAECIKYLEVLPVHDNDGNINNLASRLNWRLHVKAQKEIYDYLVQHQSEWPEGTDTALDVSYTEDGMQAILSIQDVIIGAEWKIWNVWLKIRKTIADACGNVSQVYVWEYKRIQVFKLYIWDMMIAFSVHPENVVIWKPDTPLDTKPPGSLVTSYGPVKIVNVWKWVNVPMNVVGGKLYLSTHYSPSGKNQSGNWPYVKRAKYFRQYMDGEIVPWSTNVYKSDSDWFYRPWGSTLTTTNVAIWNPAYYKIAKVAYRECFYFDPDEDYLEHPGDPVDPDY